MLPWEEAASQPTAQIAPMPWEEAAQAAQPQTLSDQISQDLSKRANAVTSAKDLPNFLISSARLGVGGAADVGGDILGAIPGAGMIKSAASGIANAYGQLPLRNGGTFSDVGNSFTGMLDKAGKVYPTAANAAGYVTDVGNLAAEKGIVGLGKSAVNGVSDMMANKSIGTAPPKPSFADQAAQDKATAGAGYNAQEDITFAPDQLKKLQGNLQSLIPTKDASLRVWNNSPAAGHVNDLIDTINKEPLTFSGALDQRADINDSWVKATRAGAANQVRMINQVKEALDKTMINPETGDWQGANRQFGIAATKQDFSKMVDVADMKAQPGNALDTAINKYTMGWQGKTLRPNERAILDQITSNSFTKELKKNVAGRLTGYVATGIGAGLGGVPGAIIGDLLGTYASKFARDTVMQDKIAALQTFFDELDKRPMPEVPKTEPPTPQPMKLLPSPENMSALPMTDSQIAIARAKLRQTYQPTGADMSGGAATGNIVPQNQRLRLPSPKQLSPLPASPQQIAQAQAQLAARGNAVNPQYSGNATWPQQVGNFDPAWLKALGMSPMDAMAYLKHLKGK